VRKEFNKIEYVSRPAPPVFNGEVHLTNQSTEDLDENNHTDNTIRQLQGSLISSAVKPRRSGRGYEAPQTL